MKQQQKIVILAGAAGAYYLLTRKKSTTTTSGKNPLQTALSKLLPTRGTNTPSVASTNMATRGGTGTTARVPSSGLGFPNPSRGVTGAPTTVGGIAQGAGAALQGLFNLLARRPATPASTQPRPASQGGSPGGGSSGAGAGSGGGRNPSPMGGSAGVAGQTYSNGYFDDRGNWIGYDGYYDAAGNFIATDANGNPINTTQQTGGYFDDDGNWIADDQPIGSTPVEAGSFDENGEWIPAGTGAIDENGDYDPSADWGGEFVGPVDSTTPITDGYFADDGTWIPLDDEGRDAGFWDPNGVDDPSLTGLDDGSASTLGDDYVYDDNANDAFGGGGEDMNPDGSGWGGE